MDVLHEAAAKARTRTRGSWKRRNHWAVTERRVVICEPLAPLCDFVLVSGPENP